MVSTVRSPGSDELPRPGDIVCGKYEIEKVVGTGGMGVVMGAKDNSLGRSVAIKFLAPSRASRDGAVARFLREARAAAGIQSEHVVRVFEVDSLPTGAPFIVMEHLVGSDLGQLLQQRGALRIDEACDFILQACEALAEAHRRGIVHRDLKPQNLFLTHRADGSACMKVLDFGISSAAEDEGSAGLTSTDAVMGTPLYMSPEQVRSLRDVDARADIWALGSILFELITDAPIYDAPTASALCAMIAMDPPTPLRERLPTAPVEFEALLLRCLHKDPAGRFQDVAALADALAPFASERGRFSAERVSRVVRGSAAPAPFPSSPYASGAPPRYPEGTPTVSATVSGFPNATVPTYPPLSAPPPTTQTEWQHTNTFTQPPPARRSGGMTGTVLGIAGGAVLLVIVGGGIIYLKRDELAPSPAVPPVVAPPPAAAPTKDKEKDKDKDREEADRIAALGRQAEQACRHHTAAMSTGGVAARTRAAQEAKAATCTKGAQASRCERQICVSACTVLRDQPCVDRTNGFINNGPQPKF